MSLRKGFDLLRMLSDTWRSVQTDPDPELRVLDAFAYEATKFLVYRTLKQRDRQWLSLQRMRVLEQILEQIRRRKSYIPPPIRY